MRPTSRIYSGRMLSIWTFCFFVVLSPIAAPGDWEHVGTIEEEDPVIRAVWAAFVDRLNSGDAAGAVEYYAPDKRESASEIYELLGETIKRLPRNWSELAEPNMYGPFVSYKIMDESNRHIYSVTFLKFPDGRWLIKSL